MKKILLVFSFLVLISLLFCLKPTSANAASNFIVESARICYNSRTLYNNPYGRCYNGNWRFNTSVKNIGDSSNANEPGVVNPDYDYGYHIISSFTYGLSEEKAKGKERFFFSVSNIILAPGEHRDFYQTVSGLACDRFDIVAVGNVDANWNWNVTDIDSVGPCSAGPTPTPTPTCPATFSQTVADGAYNLGTTYSSGASVPFTPPFSAGVNKIEIYGGKHAVAVSEERSITCKLQTGSTILGEATTALLDAAAAWRQLNFSSAMWLTSGTTYTLYCRQTSGTNFQTYWMYDSSSGIKTYKFHLDFCCFSATLSPSSFTLAPTQTQVVQVTGLAGSSALLDKDVDHVTFTSSNPSVVSVSPASDNTYPFQTTATGVAIGGPVPITANIFLKPDDGNTDCFGTATVTVKELVNTWFQTQEGDVHAGGDIVSSIPTSITERNFSITPAGGYPGIVSYGDDAFFGGGFPSANQANHWLANSPSLRNSYSFFYHLLDSPTLETPPPEIRNEDLPAADGVKAYNGNVQTGNTWQIGTKKIVILTSGSFLIKHRILIDQGGSLVVIAKEGLGVSKNLIATGEQNNYLGGIFITDGTFYSSVEESFPLTSVTSAKVLVVQGGVIANSVNLSRDLGEDNGTTPAEKFLYRPDLLINSYSGLWRATNTWQELAP